MKANQISAVFASIKQRTTKEPPYRVGVSMADGQRFSGSAHPATAAGLVQFEADRIALAHLMKPPETIWLDVDSIQAMTDNEILSTPLPLATPLGVDSRKDGTEPVTQEKPEDMKR